MCYIHMCAARRAPADRKGVALETVSKQENIATSVICIFSILTILTHFNGILTLF